MVASLVPSLPDLHSTHARMQRSVRLGTRLGGSYIHLPTARYVLSYLYPPARMQKVGACFWNQIPYKYCQIMVNEL